MKAQSIPYTIEWDEESHCHVLSALDRHGNTLAVVSEPTLDAAEVELAALLLHLLEAEAANGRDRAGDLYDVVPPGPHVTLPPLQVLPIRLKLARARADLRQADMASLLGISQQTYAKLERPGANPTLQTLAKVEQALGRDLLCWA